MKRQLASAWGIHFIRRHAAAGQRVAWTPPARCVGVLLGGVVLLLGLFAGGRAAAQGQPPEICTPTNCVPPAKRKYKPGNQQVAEAHQRWGSNIARKPSHKDFSGWDAPPPPVPGGSSIHIFGSTLNALFSADGGATYVEVSVPARVRVRLDHDHMEGNKQVIRAEMEEMSMTNTSPLIIVRESPSLLSTGITTIRPVSGGYAISSFFDVFTELSLDGGVSWIPSEENGMPLGTRMVLTEDDGAPLTAASDTAPPRNAVYCEPPTNWPTMFGGNVQAKNFKHKDLPSRTIPPPLGQNAFYSAAGTTIEADVSLDNGQTFQHVSAPAQVAVVMRHSVDAGQARYFDTEMVALDLSGGGLPSNVRLRESPTLPSLGEHILRPALGGGFRVNSYFDVNLELSIDNGQSWIPASGPVHLDVAPPPAPIPTLSEWGLIILGLLLLIVGTVALRRQQLAPAWAGAAGSSAGRPVFLDGALFRKVAGGVLAVAVVALALAQWNHSALAARDVIGTLLSAVLFAYWLHLLIAWRQDPAGRE